MTTKASPGKKQQKMGKLQAIKSSSQKTQTNEVVRQVRELAWVGRHAQAIEVASQALAGKAIKLHIRIDLLDLRAESYNALGKLELAARDANAMVRLVDAEEKLSPVRKHGLKAQALNRKALVQMRQGQLHAALKTAKSALNNAQRCGQDSLIADSLFRVGEAQFRSGQNEAAIESAQKAIPIYQQMGDDSGAGRAYWTMASANNLLGRAEEYIKAVQTALDLCLSTSDQYGIGNAYNAFSISEKYIARRMKYLQQASQAFERAGYAERQTMVLGNLSISYGELGLHSHFARLCKEVNDQNREMGAKAALTYGLGNLVDAHIRLNDIASAKKHLPEFADLVSSLGDPGMDIALAITQGDLALIEGKLTTAIRQYRSVVEIAHQAGMPHEITGLTLLGKAQLLSGNPRAALIASTKATDLHRSLSFITLDTLSSQEIWWRHAQASIANGKMEQGQEALERAYGFLLESISNLGDEGLRRNYLNKVSGNRELLKDWVEDGLRRKLSQERIYAHLAIESSLREPFERLADTGLRLNTLHKLSEIRSFLVEEATELTGGERVVLIRELDGKREITEAALPRGEDPAKILRSINTHLDHARLSHTTNLILPGKKGLSRIVAPLIAQDNLLGYLYIDMDAIYGKFNEVDRDMVGMLANQACCCPG